MVFFFTKGAVALSDIFLNATAPYYPHCSKQKRFQADRPSVPQPMSREEIVGKRRNRELCPFRLADLRTAKNRISGKTAPSK